MVVTQVGQFQVRTVVLVELGQDAGDVHDAFDLQNRYAINSRELSQVDTVVENGGGAFEAFVRNTVDDQLGVLDRVLTGSRDRLTKGDLVSSEFQERVVIVQHRNDLVFRQHTYVIALGHGGVTFSTK
ncbi:hypothetical protein D3C87_1650760 [compost metagenome]